MSVTVHWWIVYTAMYSRNEGLRFNVYVGSRADWHFDSRLYSSRVIGAKLAHNIILRAIDS